MRGVRLVAAAVLAWSAGCGGAPEPPPPSSSSTGAGVAPREAPAPGSPTAPAPGWIRADLRSPDARSPLMRAEGTWRCPAGSSALLQVGRYGTAALSSGGRPLAYVTGRHALIHRVCDPAASVRGGPPAFGRAGPGLLRCRAPGELLVDFRAGDLTVRAGRRGRFLAGAAVGTGHLGVARYWAAACRPA